MDDSAVILSRNDADFQLIEQQYLDAIDSQLRSIDSRLNQFELKLSNQSPRLQCNHECKCTKCDLLEKRIAVLEKKISSPPPPPTTAHTREENTQIVPLVTVCGGLLLIGSVLSGVFVSNRQPPK